MTPSEDTSADAMSSTSLKQFTQHTVEDMAGSISGELTSGFPEEPLERISGPSSRRVDGMSETSLQTKANSAMHT